MKGWEIRTPRASKAVKALIGRIDNREVESVRQGEGRTLRWKIMFASRIVGGASGMLIVELMAQVDGTGEQLESTRLS